MQTKSNIQLIMEESEIRTKVYNTLAGLVDNYLINDSIFAHANGNVYEVTSGYFQPTKIGDLKDLVYEMNSNQGIRIYGEKYYLGDLYNKITDVPDVTKVLEIKHI